MVLLPSVGYVRAFSLSGVANYLISYANERDGSLILCIRSFYVYPSLKVSSSLLRVFFGFLAESLGRYVNVAIRAYNMHEGGLVPMIFLEYGSPRVFTLLVDLFVLYGLLGLDGRKAVFRVVTVRSHVAIARVAFIFVIRGSDAYGVMVLLVDSIGVDFVIFTVRGKVVSVQRYFRVGPSRCVVVCAFGEYGIGVREYFRLATNFQSYHFSVQVSFYCHRLYSQVMLVHAFLVFYVGVGRVVSYVARCASYYSRGGHRRGVPYYLLFFELFF